MMKNSSAQIRIMMQLLGEMKKQTEILMKQTEFIKSWMKQDKHYHDKTLDKMK